MKLLGLFEKRTTVPIEQIEETIQFLKKTEKMLAKLADEQSHDFADDMINCGEMVYRLELLKKFAYRRLI